MVDQQLSRRAFALLTQCAVLQHGVHVLSVEHVVDIAPSLLVVVKAILADWLTRLPVAVDQPLEDDRVTLSDIDVPLVQPSCAVRRARD